MPRPDEPRDHQNRMGGLIGERHIQSMRNVYTKPAALAIADAIAAAGPDNSVYRPARLSLSWPATASKWV